MTPEQNRKLILDRLELRPGTSKGIANDVGLSLSVAKRIITELRRRSYIHKFGMDCNAPIYAMGPMPGKKVIPFQEAPRPKKVGKGEVQSAHHVKASERVPLTANPDPWLASWIGQGASA